MGPYIVSPCTIGGCIPVTTVVPDNQSTNQPLLQTTSHRQLFGLVNWTLILAAAVKHILTSSQAAEFDLEGGI